MPDPPAPDRPGSQGFELRRSESPEPQSDGPPPLAAARTRPRLAALAGALLVLLFLAVLVWLLAT